MIALSAKHSTPLPKGTPSLSPQRARKLLTELPGWSVNETATELRREFKFDSYARTIAFANMVAFLAERQDHHPDLEVGWGRCVVRYSTHSVNGLSENDFICAAKIDALLDIAG
jgi:4a-hydroxytetrahydrobiopterin dehydratase